MMRIMSFLAVLTGLFTAATLAAQNPDPAMPAAPPPPPPVEAENVWNLDLSTGGRVAIQLRPDVAPAHVERVKTLTRQGFYDGLVFHRVIEGFMAQGGDPTASGTGGSTLPDIAAEIKGLPHVRGAVGMARGQELNSANSQFYLMFVPRLSMDRNYTIFGRVISGMNFVDAIARGEPPINPTRIVRASIGSDNVPMMSAEALRAAGQGAPAQAAATPDATLRVAPDAQALSLSPAGEAAVEAAAEAAVAADAAEPAPASGGSPE